MLKFRKILPRNVIQDAKRTIRTVHQKRQRGADVGMPEFSDEVKRILHLKELFTIPQEFRRNSFQDDLLNLEISLHLFREPRFPHAAASKQLYDPVA